MADVSKCKTFCELQGACLTINKKLTAEIFIKEALTVEGKVYIKDAGGNILSEQSFNPINWQKCGNLIEKLLFDTAKLMVAKA